MWVYQRDPAAPPAGGATPFPTNADSAPGLWQVGWQTPDGTFKIVRLQTSERDAARVVHYLNGGSPSEWPPSDPR